MAERRMFTKKIIDSDAFLDMPLSTQSLYFRLNMRADDDGFLNNPKKIQRMIGASDDDLKLLFAKRFVLAFDNGVVVIKHWRMHNLIKKDRYNPTQYIEERNTLTVKSDGSYTERTEDDLLPPPCQPSGTQVETKRNTSGTQVEPQYRLGEYRSEEGKDITTTTTGEAPLLTTVFLYFKGMIDGDAAKEAEKFHAYNEKRGWDCLPNWQATADLWIARIGDKGARS